MKKQEVVIKLINEISRISQEEISYKKLRPVIEKVLYDYDVKDKETSIALLDNINEHIKIYLASRKIEGLADSTIRNYSRVLLKFSDSIRKNVEEVTAMDIRMFMYEYSKTGVKNSTVSHYTNVIRGFFKWLENEEYISSNPARGINSPKVEKRIRKALTKKEFETLRTGAKNLRQKALLELLYSTGCRLNEVVNIKKSDIDWQNLMIKVVGKGNKERYVYMNATCQVHLTKYINSRNDDNDSIFVTKRKPIGKMGARAIQDEIDKIAKQSNIGINVYPHLIRHTTATHLLDSGMSLEVLQRILGHENTATTLIYAEINNSKINNEYRKYS